jgi:hypothetical protein
VWLETVFFPSETEAFGRVEIGWRLPGRIEANRDVLAHVAVLCDYLDDGITAPL